MSFYPYIIVWVCPVCMMPLAGYQPNTTACPGHWIKP
jgi:hypothetical protein